MTYTGISILIVISILLVELLLGAVIYLIRARQFKKEEMLYIKETTERLERMIENANYD